MPRTYELILGGNNNLAQVNFAADAPQQTRGKEFFDRCNRMGMTPATQMTNITTWFHRLLQRENWTWDPSVPAAGNIDPVRPMYHQGAKVLDNTQNTGECAFPALALCLLVNADNPWGWQDGGATVRAWDGQHQEGFLCAHNNEFGLPPNVTQPNGQRLNGYYLWGNHKVLDYGGLYYDACYDKTYAALGDMALVSLQLVRQMARLRDLREHGGLFGNIKFGTTAFSDWVTGNMHQINVYQAVNAGPLTGYYIGWGQQWNWWYSNGFVAEYIGPYAVNPLIR